MKQEIDIQKKIKELKAAEIKASEINSKLYRIETDLLKSTLGQDVDISDHAIVRYLERVRGINILIIYLTPIKNIQII